MSDAFAIARKNLGHELGELAEQHFKHDLNQSDRDALRKAASTVSNHATVGSLLGLSLGFFLAYRLRSSRAAIFRAVKASERPTAVQFADGTTKPLPDLALAMKPSTVGTFFTYTLLGAGGVFFGGESGLLTGTFTARRSIMKDRQSFERIESAFKNFQADALRKQADTLDQGAGRTLAQKLTGR